MVQLSMTLSDLNRNFKVAKFFNIEYQKQHEIVIVTTEIQ